MNEDIVYGGATGLILLSPLIAIIAINIGSWKDSRKNTTKIPLKSFKKIYAINPDSWFLYSSTVCRFYRKKYEVIPFVTSNRGQNCYTGNDNMKDTEYDPVTDKYYKYIKTDIELSFSFLDFIKYRFWRLKVKREKSRREKLNSDTETLQFLRSLAEEDIKTYTDRIKREGQEQLDKLLREAEEREKKFNKGVGKHEPGIDEGVSSIIT